MNALASLFALIMALAVLTISVSTTLEQERQCKAQPTAPACKHGSR